MATLGNTYLGLIDLYKQQGGKGEIVSTIMEMLHQMNPFLAEMIFIQCNCKTKHVTLTLNMFKCAYLCLTCNIEIFVISAK